MDLVIGKPMELIVGKPSSTAVYFDLGNTRGTDKGGIYLNAILDGKTFRLMTIEEDGVTSIEESNLERVGLKLKVHKGKT